MKEIGILTFWNVPNYGAFLQAYALQKYIESIDKEYKVRQIVYLNETHYCAYYSIIDKSFRYWIINPKFYKKLVNRTIHRNEIKTTRDFLKYYDMIPHTEKYNAYSLKNMKVDVLVLGSDIIWDYNITIFGKDEFLFGNHINANNKISYAPSFGTVNYTEKVPTYVVSGLKNLKAISVRDEKSRRLVKEISERSAEIVVDPTLLWDFESDSNIKRPDENCKYIIVYGSFFAEQLIIEAQKYCSEQGIKLICLSSLNDKFDWCDITVNQDELNPFQWAGYFKYADAVMTCTYHGLMFGLIFRKKIIFNPTDFIMEKASYLISQLGLYSVLIENKGFVEKLEWDWNYEIIDEQLLEMKEKSKKYLNEAIEL